MSTHCPKASEHSLKRNKYYFWCSCSNSSTLPFCNGSHDGSKIRPLVFQVDRDESKTLCGCGKTATPPYCDASDHKN